LFFINFIPYKFPLPSTKQSCGDNIWAQAALPIDDLHEVISSSSCSCDINSSAPVVPLQRTQNIYRSDSVKQIICESIRNDENIDGVKYLRVDQISGKFSVIWALAARKLRPIVRALQM